MFIVLTLLYNVGHNLGTIAILGDKNPQFARWHKHDVATMQEVLLALCDGSKRCQSSVPPRADHL